MDFSDIVDDRDRASTPLEGAHLIELRMLRILDRICREHGICYSLAYGTLLGAVRHGGFIPWDDDVDVIMPMGDYVKFIEIASRELPPDMLLVDPQSDKSRVGFVKIFDLKSFYLDIGTRYLDMSAPQGVFIDIFPIRRYSFFYGQYLHRKVVRLVFHAQRKSRRIGRISIGGAIGRVWWSFVIVLTRPLERFFRHDNGSVAAIPPENGSDLVLWRAADVFPMDGVVNFCGHSFHAPHDIDAYLAMTYGDYMKLPPEKDRTYHAALIVTRK